MTDSDDTAFVEFEQNYGDRDKVLKRGIVASSLVVRKYDLQSHESVAFTSWEGKHRAMTVFHFHPSFPQSAWKDYMEHHRDGVDVLCEAEEARGRMREEDWEIHARRAGAWRQRNGEALLSLWKSCVDVLALPAHFLKHAVQAIKADRHAKSNGAYSAPPLRSSLPMRPLPPRSLGGKNGPIISGVDVRTPKETNVVRLPH